MNAPAATVSFTTWQFVRLMVRLEDTAGRHRSRQRLLATWQADWEALDRQLEELRQSDFEAFADLMMNHDITFEDVGAEHLDTLHRLAVEVAKELAQAVRGAKGDGRRDLEREAREMKALAADIQALASVREA